jgi:hypothetical protein
MLWVMSVDGHRHYRFKSFKRLCNLILWLARKHEELAMLGVEIILDLAFEV